VIDISQETLVLIREVPRLLPPRPSGKRVHIRAVYRWTQRGIRGAVLEAIRIGGTTYTSAEISIATRDANDGLSGCFVLGVLRWFEPKPGHVQHLRPMPKP